MQKKTQEEAKAGGSDSTSQAISSSKQLNKISSAQIRLQKDITELDLPTSIKLTFPDADDFFNFNLTIFPQQGYYKSGSFHFKVEINGNFPMEPPKIKCTDVIYHPNIDLQGNICLNILREDWSPVLNLNSVLIGLNFLFLEPNPNDPLNKDAANVLVKDTHLFAKKVKESMRGGYMDGHMYDRVI